ncbi:hypothetical protein [Leptospira alstonii]|uniref:Queuosine biosynthesis protein QueC-like protein n=2 Tax=Leptospira alstonii TaxID=28452 RepID=M6D2Q3_9LEPT|nr:hypothetical protein [Leptospira alstonii]EMJ95458.1 hypothetical protein LEP1GSC194_3709 [Leptospira alstonii serovar Sichuan str. 79601]EQA80147.1 hypothetical protein LEP1GSC193_0930 [Leptospira alstonii serovar Pingchang str. 80-412]
MKEYFVKEISNLESSFQIEHNGRAIRFRRIDGIELHRRSAFPCDTSIDLCNIIGIVSVVERLIPRLENTDVRISLPVRTLEKWQDFEITDDLKFVISQFSANNYEFNFYQSKISSVREGNQGFLSVDEDVEVCLWSGGLDSLSGLLNRYLENPDKNYELIGLGSQNVTFGKQKSLRNEIKRVYPISKIERYRIFHQLKGMPKKYPNPSFRIRGLLFLVEGLYASNLLNSKSLYLYENGIGAFNIPFPGSGHWDRSLTANPLSLSIVSKFYSKLIGKEMRILNPFLFSTKGEMCKVFKRDMLIHSSLVKSSTSCDSHHRQKGYPTQCGYCSSCLLRRQGIFGAGLVDQTRYSFPQIVEGKRLRHFDQFTNQADLWSRFVKEGVDQIYQQDSLIYESKRHIMKEWNISGEEFDQKFEKLAVTQINEWRSFSKFMTSSNKQSAIP